MKTEINLENKAKFFGQYLNQQVHTEPDFDLAVTVLYGIDLDDVSGNDFLTLKPLSSITDEDAVEVTRICIDPKEKPLEVLEIFSWDWRKSIVIYSQPHINNHNVLLEMSIAIVFDSCEIKFIWEHNHEKGTGIEERHCPNSIVAYDYLRSKGYALPFMGLSVEEMVEAGWIKLVKE